MKSIFKLSCVILLVPVMLVCEASFVSAADFTLDVPVTFTNMHPDINRGRVSCYVSKLRPGSTGAASAANKVGDGTSEFTINSGRFSGNVRVTFNAFTHQRPQEAISYHCTINIRCTCDGYWHPSTWLRTAYRGLYTLSRAPRANIPWAEGMLH